jgi:anaerobic C4-dicarboxylate transporter DcuA/anaerobic C4-dicarboxylate transporter DcuB
MVQEGQIMNDTAEIVLQGLVVIGAIAMGVRTGGMAVGMWGAAGVLVLSTLFQLSPGSVPTSAILIILSVITAASAMQVAGGLTWLVAIADRLLKRNPKMITFVAPYTTWIFTTGAGTGNVYYSMLPVIEEVSYENDVRPERPLSAAPVGSQLGITSSPVSAAMAVMVGLMEPVGFEIVDILVIVIPATAIAIFAVGLVNFKRGKELRDDPEFQRKLAAGEIVARERTDLEISPTAKRSAIIFLLGILTIVLFGMFDEIRPRIDVDGELEPIDMTSLIQIIMLITALVIVLATKVQVKKIPTATIFNAGTVAIVALFGVAWLANTFIEANQDVIVDELGQLAEKSMLFIAVAIFIVAALTTSQSSTTAAIIPIGITLGIEPQYLVAMWPAVIGIYFFPINGGQIATAEFDRTGTTTIGKRVIDHSFMIPTLVAAVTVVAAGMGFAALFY